jgi:hypothetical protein
MRRLTTRGRLDARGDDDGSAGRRSRRVVVVVIALAVVIVVLHLSGTIGGGSH